MEAEHDFIMFLLQTIPHLDIPQGRPIEHRNRFIYVQNNHFVLPFTLYQKVFVILEPMERKDPDEIEIFYMASPVSNEKWLHFVTAHAFEINVSTLSKVKDRIT